MTENEMQHQKNCGIQQMQCREREVYNLPQKSRKVTNEQLYMYLKELEK